MAEEEVKVEEVKTETPETPTQEELPLAAASEETKEAEPVKAEEKKEEPKVEEPKVDWRDKEIKAKHRRQKELEQQLADERAKREAAEALAAKFNQTQPYQEQLVPVSEVERRAAELEATKERNKLFQKIEDEGPKKYPEWNQAISNLQVLGEGAAPFDQRTIDGILATDDPAKVLFEIGKDPNIYHRLMALPYERRLIEMGKMAMQPVQNKPVSNAPAPVNPVGGRAAPATETLRDDMPDDQWYRVRAQLRKKREGGDPTKFKAAQY